MFQRIAIFAVAVLAGCTHARVIRGHYTSQVDPDFRITTGKVIGIFPIEGRNELETKYYIKQIARNLQSRGFRHVYTYSNVADASRPLEIAVFVTVGKDTSTYQYRAPILGMVDSGTSTVNCTGFGYTVNCTEQRQKQLGVTGYSTLTGYRTDYYLMMDWYRADTQQKVMSVFAASSPSGCADRAVYEFLIAETVSRLDFEKPATYDYSVQMPETYTCNE